MTHEQKLIVERFEKSNEDLSSAIKKVNDLRTEIMSCNLLFTPKINQTEQLAHKMYGIIYELTKLDVTIVEFHDLISELENIDIEYMRLKSLQQQ